MTVYGQLLALSYEGRLSALQTQHSKFMSESPRCLPINVLMEGNMMTSAGNWFQIWIAAGKKRLTVNWTSSFRTGLAFRTG